MNKRIIASVLASFALLLGLVSASRVYVYAQVILSTAGTSIATSTPSVSDKFTVGERVYTTSSLKLRSAPDLTASPLGSQMASTTATIIGGPAQSGESIFWDVRYDAGAEGWSLESGLSALAPTSTPFISYSPAGERKLTSLLAGRSNPSISGSAVVWSDGRNGGSDIYWYDLASNIETRLTGGTGFDTHPSIDGSRVAYLDRAPDPNSPGHDATRVVIFDLPSRSSRPLDTSSSFQAEPDVSGDLVAYVQIDQPGRSLILYNLASNSKQTIAAGPGITGVRVAGTHIVWMDSVNGVWKVFAYDTELNAQRMVFDDPGDQTDPAVSSDGKVAFADRRGGSGADDWNVYLSDPATGVTGPISNGSGSQPTGISISGNLISWVQGGEVYLKNLTTGTQTQLTHLAGERSDTALSGNTLVWLDGRNGAKDVYLWNAK